MPGVAGSSPASLTNHNPRAKTAWRVGQSGLARLLYCSPRSRSPTMQRLIDRIRAIIGDWYSRTGGWYGCLA